MIIVKKTTKKGEGMVQRASYCEGRTLYDVYSSHSQAKEKAFHWCRGQCFEEHGHNFRIISHNTFGFSVAWDTEEGLRIETPQNSYLIK